MLSNMLLLVVCLVLSCTFCAVVMMRQHNLPVLNVLEKLPC